MAAGCSSARSTARSFAPDESGEDHCGSCTACQTACPTDAFPAPYRLDARRCISYLTIEHKGPIPQEFRKAIGNRIYGCDDCLAVCPWNKFADLAARHQAFVPREELVGAHAGRSADARRYRVPREVLRQPDQADRARPLRAQLPDCRGNSGNAALKRQVEGLVADPDPVVAEAAEWALKELTAAP